MKKQIIGTLVAGIIIFFWQFVSWTFSGVHTTEMQYTAKQDAIMETLAAQGLEDGTYYIPQAPPGSTAEEHQKLMEDAMGKPWAVVTYRKAYNASMGMNMSRGMAVDLLAAFLLIWLLMKIPGLDFKTCIQGAFAVGAIGYLTIPYLDAIWFETNSMGYLIDLVVQWGLVGAWLGFWLPRK
ncbi:MAG: hypothetical protein R2792_03025 [Saprospiraceae bacterium]|jgi:hypothetical protein